MYVLLFHNKILFFNAKRKLETQSFINKIITSSNDTSFLREHNFLILLLMNFSAPSKFVQIFQRTSLQILSLIWLMVTSCLFLLSCTQEWHKSTLNFRQPVTVSRKTLWLVLKLPEYFVFFFKLCNLKHQT